jgi:hypothetical protein
MTFLTHLEDSTIQKLVSGDLAEAEANAAHAHLDECAPCRRRASRMSSLFAMLGDPPALPAPPIDFAAAVMARVDKEGQAPAIKVAARSAAVAAAQTAALRAFAAGASTLLSGIGLAAAEGSSPHLPQMVAGFVTHAVSFATHSGVVLTVLKAGAPVLGAAASASLAALAPLIWKALSSLKPNTARAAART